MIFSKEHIEKIKRGEKTMTRRIQKPDEYYQKLYLSDGNRLHRVLKNGRLKWAEDKTYAVQAGRGKPSLFRIEILNIFDEHLHDITPKDAMWEGGYTISRFQTAWDDINAKHGHRWEDNPKVWVLQFRLMNS